MPFNDLNATPYQGNAGGANGISMQDIMAFLQRLRGMAPQGLGGFGSPRPQMQPPPMMPSHNPMGGPMMGMGGPPPDMGPQLPPMGPQLPTGPSGPQLPRRPPPGLRQSPLMSAISMPPGGMSPGLPGEMGSMPPPGNGGDLPSAPLTPPNYQGFDNNMPNVGPQMNPANSAANMNGPQSTGDLVSLIRRLIGR